MRLDTFSKLEDNFYFLLLLKTSPEERRADCNLNEACKCDREAGVFCDRFSISCGTDRLVSFPFSFLSFFPRFSPSRSRCRSILGEHREQTYSRCGILDVGEYRDPGHLRRVVHKPRSSPLPLMGCAQRPT